MSDWGEIDKKYVWHPFTQMQDWCASEPLVLVEGKGAILTDSLGRRYIDGNSSIWTNIHGHGHPHLIQSVKDQLDAVAHVSFLGTTNVPAIKLAQKLVQLFPGGSLTRVFYSDNGSTAVEVALKMAMQFSQLTGRPRGRFAAFSKAYHGDTAGAASVGGISVFSDRFASMHFQPVRVDTMADLYRLDRETVADLAAVIIEPMVQGTAGVRLWPSGMLRALRDWCDSQGVLLIFDEVLTGFGRTGKMFACEHEGVFPDFMALAKGLTGGLMPLAVTLTTEKIYEAFLGTYEERKTFFYGHSYCGNPLGCAAALASLELFETENVLANLDAKIASFTAMLAHLGNHPHVGSIRQCGLIAGVDLVADKAAGASYDWREQTGARVCLAARDHGLLTRPILDTVILMPPLCITLEEIHQMGEAFQNAMNATLEPGAAP